MLYSSPMRRRYAAYAIAGALIALTQPAFAATPTKSTPPAARPAYPALVHKKELYDSVLSVNDRCPVRGGPLNKNVRPMYVNRQPVGFC